MASLPPDPWKALGVDREADKAEIRAAYKKLVLKCHPDKVQDPALKAQKQEEFQKVQQAWELLNDDAERVKYEEAVKIAELRKQAAMIAKSMPNSSAPRTPTRHYEIRTAEPRYKASPSSGGKVYPHHPAAHSRSHEDVPSRYDGIEKIARRTTSYDKSFRDEERRERERRSRRDPEEDFRIRERERDRDRDRAILKEKEKELKEREKEYRKRADRERDKERKRNQEDKRRYASPYIEEPAEPEDDQYPSSSKPEKKRSSSKKPYDGRERERDRDREREKSSASRQPPSPLIETVSPPLPEAKLFDDLDKAATYIERSKRQNRVETFAPPVAPTPPPADLDEEVIHRAARARRSSHDASRSREKLMYPQKPYIVEASSPKSSGARIPGLHKSHTTPLAVPEPSSPPRVGVNRAHTTQDFGPSSVPQMPPSLGRTRTWAGQEYQHEFYGEDSGDEHHHHQHRRERERDRRNSRRRSPESPAVRSSYKVGSDLKTTKVVDAHGYGMSPNSSRYMPSDPYGQHAASTSYPSYFKVKESRSYGPEDVKYADTRYNVAYAPDQYSQVYA